MSATAATTNDLSRIHVRLRDDLRIVPQTFAGERVYVVEDPLSGKFYRLGAAECQFALQLDGRRSAADALKCAETVGETPLEASQAASFCGWLVESGLAHSPGSLSPQWLDETARRHAQRSRSGRMNLISMTIPLFCPDRLLTGLASRTAWLFSWPAAAGALAVMAIGVWRVAAAVEPLWPSLRSVFAPDQTIQLGIVWIVLKTIHELSHALACKRFGGHVAEAGLSFVLFAPKPYVDVTSSWRFRSKWRRIAVGAAGMFAECLVASLALIAWSVAPPGLGKQFCVRIVAIAGVSTLAFNANPLMRFDGYYIFSDLLEAPNLYTLGRQHVARWAKRWLLGIEPPTAASHSTMLVQAYGFASLVWRLSVSVGLVIAAGAMFHGAGLALALAAAISWWAMPAWRLVTYVAKAPSNESPRRALLLARIALIGAVLGLSLYYLPWPGATWAPGVVEPDPLVVIRATSAGFIRELYVTDGQEVQQGDLIATLANDQLDLEAAQLELDTAKSQVRAHSLLQRGELAALAGERSKLAALETQLAEKRHRIESLRIVASADGKIVSRRLASQLGARLEPGQELCAVAGPIRREIRLSVSQETVRAFEARLGETVHIHLPGQSSLEGTLSSIDPAATRQIPSPALASLYGGPLAVKQSKSETGSPELEFLEPRFTARVVPTIPAGRDLWAGQRCEVEFLDSHKTVGQYLYRAAANWLSDAWKRASQR